MTFEDFGISIAQAITAAVVQLGNFLPNLIGGMIILIIGIIVGSILHQVVLGILRVVKLEAFLKKYGVPEGRESMSWSNIIAELIRWFVIIVFLIPAVGVWQIPHAAVVLTNVFLYIPNVIVAVIIAVVGIVVANLAHDVVAAAARGLSVRGAQTGAVIAKWSIMVFVVLAVLTQLGIAADLVRILFTGFVALIAIAGGISFGLGGQGVAREVLEAIKARFKA